jgi:outer membrane lipoprotein-sorting protein
MQKFVTGLAVLLICSLGMVFISSAAAEKSKGMAAAMREAGCTFKTAQWTSLSTQTRGQEAPTKETVKFWMSGDKFRMESQDKKTKETMIMIDDGKEQYMYTPAKKSAMKLSGFMKQMYSGFFSGDMFAKAAEQRKKAKKTGSETIDGKSCSIYEYQSEVSNIKSDVKEWVWDSKNFPIKSISVVHMSPVTTTENLITELALDQTIPDSMFKLPEGVEITDLGGMGGQPQTEKAGNSAKPGSQGKEQAGEETEKPKENPVDVQKMMKSFF